MSSDPTPLYFPSKDQTLFGWLHPARGATPSDAGVVICSPFGYEAICAHWSLRTFADTCAAAGMHALRFDYSGTGDSSGSVGEEDLISGWCDDVRAAIEMLERTCGVRRILLVGVRLGALIAALVAAEQRIDAIIAVAPVANGRRYLRELRAFQASIELSGSPPPSAGQSQTPADGGLEVTGFRLSPVSVETLERIDLSKLSDGPQTAALILDRDDLPGAKPWATALESEGVQVQYAALPGFTDMVSTPHTSVVPVAMVETMAQWLEKYRVQSEPAEPMPTQVRLPAGARMRIKDESGVELIERAMFVDDERTLFAIVTEPAERAVGMDTSGYGVVMLNGGATNHIGPNRMYVELSRRWAARGYVVLRLDLAGLGDSGIRPGEEKNQVYPPGALHDVGVAIEFLRRRRGVHNITLAGLCAGAYHALRSAISGLPVNTVLLVNPLTFYWKQGSTFSDLQISEVVRNPAVYVENALSLRHWSKLLRGRVNLWRVGMVFLQRSWLAVDSSLRDVCRRLKIPLPNDLGRDLQSVASRGVRIVFFFARTDAGPKLLKVQGGSAVKRLGDRCRIHTIDGADHIFTQRAARTRLLQLLSNELPL
jgi:alpha-beta hydrolase superfamily lysophospholipase